MLAYSLALVLSSTPEGALKDFFAALNKIDVPAAAGLIEGADAKANRKELATKMAEQPVKFEIGSIKREGNRLLVEFKILPNGHGPITRKDSIDAVQTPNGWKLVAPKKIEKDDVLGALVAMIKDDAVYQKGSVYAKRGVAISNLKQIALATIILAADNKDAVKMTAADAEVKIYPYLKNREVFKDPGTGRDDVYVFNKEMEGVVLDKVAKPAETVLWSLGSKNGLIYAYEGLTIVAFADGHVKAITKEEAAKLVWKP